MQICIDQYLELIHSSPENIKAFFAILREAVITFFSKTHGYLIEILVMDAFFTFMHTGNPTEHRILAVVHSHVYGIRT